MKSILGMHVGLASMEFFPQRRRTHFMLRQHVLRPIIIDLLLPAQMLIISRLVEGHSLFLRRPLIRSLCVLLNLHLIIGKSDRLLVIRGHGGLTLGGWLVFEVISTGRILRRVFFLAVGDGGLLAAFFVRSGAGAFRVRPEWRFIGFSVARFPEITSHASLMIYIQTIFLHFRIGFHRIEALMLFDR